MSGIPLGLNPSSLPPPDPPDPAQLGGVLEEIAKAPDAPAWATAIDKSAQTCAERRARVLSHPDLAGRLVAELGYTRPDRWNGYIPPRLGAYAEGERLRSPAGQANPDACLSTIGQQQNDSPRRRLLVDIAAEAMRRESASVQVPAQEEASQ